jgi:hypothetical protein
MTEIRQAQFGAWLGSLAALLLLFGVAPLQAQSRTSVPPPTPIATYADMADLAEAAAIVALVEVRRQTLVPPARAPGLAPGHARLYIEARTEALLAARSALGESLVYLVDVPLMPNGKPPKLRRERFLVFADPVPGRPGSLQLVAPEAQLPATPEIEQLARTVLAALAAPDVPPRLTGVRDVMSVAGNLAGESETQLFLGTATGAPVSLTVIRRPGMAPEWGVSWSEIVDQAARPPGSESIEWYRLACFLPQQLPADAFLQSDQASRRQAEADYRFILDQLGECRRLLA